MKNVKKNLINIFAAYNCNCRKSQTIKQIVLANYRVEFLMYDLYKRYHKDQFARPERRVKDGIK